VIYNGRNPELFDPNQGKEEFAISVGRLWDEGKYISLLVQAEGANTIRIVGWEQEPGREKKPLPALADNVQLLGPKSQEELREQYALAAMYVATSRYEPFGLSPLEAALSGCALVMNDIPVFHELWGDAAMYFQHSDPNDLAELLGELKHSPGLREQYGARAYETACRKFTAARMVAEYEGAYQQVAAPVVRSA